MDWTTADPATEINGAIDRLEKELRATQCCLEDAVITEQQAEGMADGARAVQTRCRCLIAGDLAELKRLRQERDAQTIPPPRIAR